MLTTGIWALRFLLLTLAITPLRRLTGWNVLIQYRRMLGLFAFFYATVHLGSYIAFDRFFAFGEILADVAKRPFITAGMAAFLLMVPLAITSTRGWIRRLGRRWQLLHRLIYLSGLAACLHFVWKVKVVLGEPVYYAAILGVLLAFRLVRLPSGVRATTMRISPRDDLRRLAPPSGRRIPPPTCRRVTLYQRVPRRPCGRLAAGFGPFTPPNCQLA